MLTLGQRSRLSFAFEPPIMRLTEDARRSVVFIGRVPDPDKPDSFVAVATAFLVEYGGVHYLVTAAHVAFGLGDSPFSMRVNMIGGAGATVHFDPLDDPLDRWFLHPDPSVDVAIMAFPLDFRQSGMNHLAISSRILLSDEGVAEHDVGPGDTCYAVGLFRLMQGKQRNVPIVHRGSIAAMPSDETLPVEDWTYQGMEPRPTIQARAYLVEATNQKGLSGSPVFVRPTIDVAATRITVDKRGQEGVTAVHGAAALSAPSVDVMLLGVWSGSWQASPDEVLALDHGSETRVPVGMGVVVPTGRILELLRSNPVKAQRDDIIAARDQPATLDSLRTELQA